MAAQQLTTTPAIWIGNLSRAHAIMSTGIEKKGTRKKGVANAFYLSNLQCGFVKSVLLKQNKPAKKIYFFMKNTKKPRFFFTPPLA